MIYPIYPELNNLGEKLSVACIFIPFILACIIALVIGFELCSKKSKKFIAVGFGLILVNLIILIAVILFTDYPEGGKSLGNFFVDIIKYPFRIVVLLYPTLVYFLLTVPVYLIFTDRIKLNKQNETKTVTKPGTKPV